MLTEKYPTEKVVTKYGHKDIWFNIVATCNSC